MKASLPAGHKTHATATIANSQLHTMLCSALLCSALYDQQALQHAYDTSHVESTVHLV